jgi:uncharacterized repeat protein (TIGR01451 family)
MTSHPTAHHISPSHSSPTAAAGTAHAAALPHSSPATTTARPAAPAILLAAALLLLPAHARAGIATAPSQAHPAAATSPHPSGIGTGPTVQSAYAGFTDLNGNGVLDCGEPVNLIATFATNNSGTPALSGSLFAPVNGTAGLSFLHGSVVIDPDLTNGCTGSILAGNGPEDTDFRVDFSCPADPIDNNSWTLVVRYRATYDGTASPPSFSAGATANLTNGATYSNVVTVPAGTACGGGGVPTEIALAKTAAGPATPASLLVYTLTATDKSGAGDGGVQLVEVVPAHTTFSPAASSPGWTCAAPPSGGTSGNAGDAGSTCRNPIGNLTPDGNLATFFAVTLDPTLPAAPVALANTACVYAGSALATCTSITTPAAGTPTLHLAKSLAPGAPAAAVPGATLAYTLTATNTGNQALADATLQETVPANTTFAPAISSGPAGSAARWSCTPSTGTPGAICTLDLGPLAAQTTAAAATFAVTVANPLPDLPPGALIANTACLQTPSAGTAGAVGVTPSCSTVNTPVTAQPVLHAAKTLRAGTGAPGTVLLYDLAVQNTGNEDAAAVTATETVPANTTFPSSPAAGATPGWSCSPATGTAGATCTLAAGSLAAGATTHLLFAVTVDLPLAAGVTAIANTACFQLLAPVLESTSRLALHRAAAAKSASAISNGPTHPRETAVPGAAGTPTCDTLSTPTQASPLLALVKSYTGPPAAAGALLPFQLTVTNTGNQDAAAITLAETVPAHTTFSPAHSTTGWTCAPAAGATGATCTLALGPLAGTPAGAPAGIGPAASSATATFAVQVASPLPAGIQQIANTACAAAPGLAPVCGQATSPPPADNAHLAAELTYTFVKNALRNGQALAGDVLNYTLTVTNPSPTAARSVAILVPLDPHLALDVGSVTTTLGTVTAGNIPSQPAGPGATIAAVQIPTLAPGATCTIQLDATVGPLPSGLRLLSTQATLTAANAPPTVSDDPNTPAPLDPTTTPVGTAPPPLVQPIPTLTTWGLLALVAALAAAALRSLHRPHRRPYTATGDHPTSTPR